MFQYLFNFAYLFVPFVLFLFVLFQFGKTNKRDKQTTHCEKGLNEIFLPVLQSGQASLPTHGQAHLPEQCLGQTFVCADISTHFVQFKTNLHMDFEHWVHEGSNFENSQDILYNF